MAYIKAAHKTTKVFVFLIIKRTAQTSKDNAKSTLLNVRTRVIQVCCKKNFFLLFGAHLV